MKSQLFKVMTEARFLAGEDARGVLVVLEPETALTNEHLDAIQDCGAAGFVSDGSDCFFEKPDTAPDLHFDRARYSGLMAFAVAPRFGVRLRTWAAKSDPAFRVRIAEDGGLSLVDQSQSTPGVRAPSPRCGARRRT